MAEISHVTLPDTNTYDIKDDITHVELTQAQYDALVSAGTVDNSKVYFITDGDATAVSATEVSYDNTTSGLTSDDVQGAIDELAAGAGGSTAATTSYDNTDSGLAATNVQDAIDEVVEDITPAIAQSGVYYVSATHSSSQTSTMTGNLHGVSALYDGLTIVYYTPYSPGSNATLNLTLDDTTTTGAIDCYIGTSVSRKVGVGDFGDKVSLIMTYQSAVTTGSTARWLITSNDLVTTGQANGSNYIVPLVQNGDMTPKFLYTANINAVPAGVNLTYSPIPGNLTTTQLNGTPVSGYAKHVKLTQAEYDALVAAGTVDLVSTVYFITDATASSFQANSIEYDNTSSGLSADDVQEAIDELVDEKADRVPAPAEYDSTFYYSRGAIVTHDGSIYQCNATSTSGAWDSSKWVLITPDTDYLHSINPIGYGALSLNRKAGYSVGTCSVATGYNNVASGSYSHAEGQNTYASNDSAHAEGFGTQASGVDSHAEGYNTTASSYAAHAEGFYAVASGAYSHAEGCYTSANHKSQHVFGEYNIEDPSTAAYNAHGNYIEIVGNGTGSSAKSNARTLDWSGNEVLSGSITATGGNIVNSNNTNTITLTGSTGEITCSKVTANVFIASSYISNQSAITYNGNSNPNYLYAVHSASNARAINKISVNMAGTGGSAGYCRVCRITVTAGYIDGAAEFKVWHRGANRPWYVYLKFASNSGTDPDVGSFKYNFPTGTGLSTYGAYIVKVTTSTWDLYIRKSQNWDDISIQVTMPRYIAGGVNMTYDTYFVTSLPSGYITATSF